MVSIKIEGYLTQNKLAAALEEIVGIDWIGSELKVPNSRRRWDMAFNFDSRMWIVEYDGDAHYRDSLTIKADIEKDYAAKELGYEVVRFPYWIQLDNMTLDHYFGLRAEVIQSFPHGFITTKKFPASFCELGLTRFRDELESLPNEIRYVVIKSLKERINEYGREYVVPVSLIELVDS